MLLIDSHLDLAWNALQWNRDLTMAVNTIRAQEGHTQGPGRASNTVAFPELRRGRVTLAFATLLARSTGRPVPHIDYAQPAQAYAIAIGQLAYYRAIEAENVARVITNKQSLDYHIKEWLEWDAVDRDDASTAPPLGFVISMEGADPILAPDQLGEWEQAGLRVLGITHYGNGRYAGGTGVETGLTDLGKSLLREMQKLSIVLDLTHCSDKSFWQALDLYEGTVLASHNNCRALVPQQRQFSDEQLTAIAARDGVIGVACDAWMLQPGFVSGQSTNEAVTLSTVVDHMDHICQVTGNSKHAAIGSDLDGGFGREQSPSDLDTIADLQRVAPLLRQRGYTESDVEAIMYGNWLRLLRMVWNH